MSSVRQRNRFSKNRLTDENLKVATQENKRKQFLLRQKTLRQDRLSKARRLLHGEGKGEGNEGEGEGEGGRGQGRQGLGRGGDDSDGSHMMDINDHDHDHGIDNNHNSDGYWGKGDKAGTGTGAGGGAGAGGGGGSKRGGGGKRGKKRKEDLNDKKNLAGEYLQEPEWMVEVPGDLCGADGQSNWFVMPKPEGQRCLVVASGGRTVSHLESGHILHNFRSALPGGGGGVRSGRASVLLDCVYSSANDVYYILDIVNWNDVSCYDCDVSFRFYWLQSKLEEIGGVLMQHCPQNIHAFCLVPRFECTPIGLEQVYAMDTVTQFEYHKNGLLFFHKEGHYEMGGLTPLALLWKDSQTCRYLDTAGPGDSGQHSVVLRVEVENDTDEIALHDNEQMEEIIEESDVMTGNCEVVDIDISRGNIPETTSTTYAKRLCTREGICLVHIPSTSQANKPLSPLDNLKAGDLVRGWVRGVGLSPALGDCGQEELLPSVEGFTFDKICSKAATGRGGDSWSKILFKFMLHGENQNVELTSISIYDIATCATSPPTPQPIENTTIFRAPFS